MYRHPQPKESAPDQGFRLCNQACVQILALLLISCVILGKFLNLSELYFFICKMRITLALRRLDDTMGGNLTHGENRPSLYHREVNNKVTINKMTKTLQCVTARMQMLASKSGFQPWLSTQHLWGLDSLSFTILICKMGMRRPPCRVSR